VHMIHATHTSMRRHERAHRDARDIEPIIPTPNYWMSCPITFNHLDGRTSIRRGGSKALVLGPIIDGYRLTRVLMDGGSSLNVIYEDTVRRMGINPSRISQSNTAFQGVIPGIEAYGRGSVVLEVTFGSPGNSRSEELLFTIAAFQSSYHALLGRTEFARFDALPHYGYLILKMPSPRGVITVNGITERSSRAEEHVTALEAGL